MRKFSEIFDIAAKRKGGPKALEALLASPLPRHELAKTENDRWLSAMAKCIFQAGFNWKVVENKWSGFEAAFDGFDPSRIGFYQDEDLDRLLSDTSIIRNGMKIRAVLENAHFVVDLAKEHGSVGRFMAGWPDEDYVDLLHLMAKRGSRLGSVTGQRVLRVMGRQSFVLSSDVNARLIAEGVVDKPATSKRDLKAVQNAFNIWADESGRGLTHISQILAFSVGSVPQE